MKLLLELLNVIHVWLQQQQVIHIDYDRDLLVSEQCMICVNIFKSKSGPVVESREKASESLVSSTRGLLKPIKGLVQSTD